MQRDPAAFLWDIREATLRIREFVAGHDFNTYQASYLVQSAVVREIAGISLGDGIEFDSQRAVAEVIREEDEYSGIRVTLDGRLSRAEIPAAVA